MRWLRSRKATHDMSFKTRDQVSFATDIGNTREINEDSILALEVNAVFESGLDRKAFLMVADGMGGGSKGEVASRLACRSMASNLCKRLHAQEKDISGLLRDLVGEANREILAYTNDHKECEGMGTTVTAALLDGDSLHVANVGDSRAYVINDKRVDQITRDHSVVQELIDGKKITAEEAQSHPQRNVITRVVGFYEDAIPDVFTSHLENQDYVVLCTDGLTTYVTAEELQHLILRTEDPDVACKALVILAKQRGGADNISLIVCHHKRENGT